MAASFLHGPLEQVFARFAAQNTTLMTRTAALIALGEAAAATDPELAEYRDRAHAETRANLRALAAELNRRGALHPDTTEQAAADTIYAVATDESVFLRLTRECGWTPADYADLITRTLNALLGERSVPSPNGRPSRVADRSAERGARSAPPMTVAGPRP